LFFPDQLTERPGQLPAERRVHNFRTRENGERYLRLRSQASRDGRTRVPLKHRKEGEGRNVPVLDYVWEMVAALRAQSRPKGNPHSPFPRPPLPNPGVAALPNRKSSPHEKARSALSPQKKGRPCPRQPPAIPQQVRRAKPGHRSQFWLSLIIWRSECRVILPYENIP
jgi:hypothetical protein